MIADWRRQFGLPDLSFFYVQLAPYRQDFSRFRLAQGAALQLPKVGFAVAIDLGDLTSPYDAIHPRRKQEVGRRLALSARAIQYADRSVVYQGPTLSAAQFVSSNTIWGTSYGARLSFVPGTADGLHAAGTADCVACCEESPFEVMDATGLWTRAAMGITGDEVSLRGVPHPIQGIRFDFEGMPQCALYNGVGGPDDHQGLAAPPFQYCAYGTHDGQPAWAASCEPNECAPVGVPVPSAGVAVAVAALGFTVLVPLPQFYKLAKARSSAGVSLFTVIITMFFSMLNVGAALITKWRQITACGHLGWSCVPNLLDLFQNIQVAIIAAIQLVMVVAYPPNTERARAMAATTLGTAIVLWVACVCASLAAPCGKRTLAFAAVQGSAGSLAALVQYAPQLLATWRHRASGSLSLLSYTVQVAGGYLNIYQSITQGASPWPVWTPWLISTSMQNAVLVSAFVFDARRWRARQRAHLGCAASKPRAQAEPFIQDLDGPPRSSSLAVEQGAEATPEDVKVAEPVPEPTTLSPSQCPSL